MQSSLKAAGSLFLTGAFLLTPLAVRGQSLPSIRRVEVLRAGAQVEIEIEASDHIVPQTNLLTHPDRLIVDFVNARPGSGLHNVAVNREQVKNLRVGLFSADPPVTRVVLDLNGPQPYQIFPSGKSVILKIGGSSGAEPAVFHADFHPDLHSDLHHDVQPALASAKFQQQATQVVSPQTAARQPLLEVSFQNGLLSISSNKANLSEILFAVHQRTGAEIDIPAGAEQEQVAVNLGPAPAPEVLAHLLNGSRFNFMILSSPTDPKAVDRVILSQRADGPMPVARPQPQIAVTSEEEGAQNIPPPPVRRVPPGPSNDGPVPPAGAPETQPAGDVPE